MATKSSPPLQLTFLHQLHTGSRFDSEGTDTDYMVRFAHRLQELEGYLVSTDNPDAFLADLIRHGFRDR